jgi:hypothetical protein
MMKNVNMEVYETPEVKVLAVESEGVLCSSGMTEKFNEQDYSDGGFWN